MRRVRQTFATAIVFGGFITIGTWPLRQAIVARLIRPSKAALGLFIGPALLGVGANTGAG